MESSLHRDLKALYADQGSRFEVPLGRYRIDVVNGDRLVEIQHGSLAAIRDKIRALLAGHHVLVVKPIVAKKRLVRLASQGGRVLGGRMSPKRGCVLDIFDDLVYFTQVFPHRKLTIDVLMVDIEEWRYPGHGRRRRWRPNDHQVEDQKLLGVRKTYRLRRASDLAELVSCPLPAPFHTAHLADALGVRRWVAQRIAYCLRKMGAAHEIGKKGNARLYRWAA